jgi:hypothetical protein
VYGVVLFFPMVLHGKAIHRKRWASECNDNYGEIKTTITRRHSVEALNLYRRVIYLCYGALS